MTGFTIGATSDFFLSDGAPKFSEFDPSVYRDEPGLSFRIIDCGDAVPQGALADVDALILMRPRVTKQSLEAASRLSLIARFGVGYERIDVAACTAAGVAVSITPYAVRRPVAVAELTMMLALAGRVFQKDAIVRRGPEAWIERTRHNGLGLTGRVLGTIGLGGIAGELIRIADPLGMTIIGYDPYLSETAELPQRVRRVSLPELLATSDFVVINCPLTPETKGLIGADHLARMKREAFLINTARGGVVDEQALADALHRGGIAGAGVDVFAEEPVPLDNPLLHAPNTILAPHSLAWTDENFEGIGASIMRSVAAVRAGRAPDELVDPAIRNNAVWREKLAAMRT